MSETPSFESNLKNLEQLVQKLERGEAPLDEAIVAFENGMKLIAVCKEQLAQTELKVEKVVAAHGGVLQTEPFNG